MGVVVKTREFADGFAGLVESYDQSLLAVESHGRGRPMLFLHGWTMTKAFWQKQAAGLADRFQVVTMDLRAHGDSGKSLNGHTLPAYARDVAAVVQALELKNFLLAGWSLAGPLVLEYYKQFQGDGVAALALVEMTPAPMSPGDWNHHRLKGYNFQSMHEVFLYMEADRMGYASNFINTMFKSGRTSSREHAWMLNEDLKTPTPQAVAIYSDYLARDYTGVLPEVKAPALVLNGESEFLCFGEKQGAWVAGQMPDAKLVMFGESGHMPFWEEPEKFNAELAGLFDRAS